MTSGVKVSSNQTYRAIPLLGKFPQAPDGLFEVVGTRGNGPRFRVMIVPPPGTDIEAPNGASWEPGREAGRQNRRHVLWLKDRDWGDYGQSEYTSWVLAVDYASPLGVPLVAGALSIGTAPLLNLPGPQHFQEVWGVDPERAFRETLMQDGRSLLEARHDKPAVELISVTVHEFYQRNSPVAYLLYIWTSKYVRWLRAQVWLANIDVSEGAAFGSVDRSLHSPLGPFADGKLFVPRPYHAKLVSHFPPKWSNNTLPTWGELERWFNHLRHSYPSVHQRVFGSKWSRYGLDERYENGSLVY